MCATPRPSPPGPSGEHRIGRANAIGPLVAQKGDEVAGRGEAHADHRRSGRLVPEIVDLVGGEIGSGREQPDRPVVDELPLLGRDQGAGVAFAVAHGQPGLVLVGRDGRIAEPHDIALAGGAGPDMKLVADAAHHRPAVFERRRQPRGHAAVGARRRRVPARPDEAVAAPEGEAQAHILGGLGIVGVGIRSGFVEAAEDHLAAAIGHVIDQHAAARLAFDRAQDEEIGLVFDHAARVLRRLVEIGDAGVFRRRRIELALRCAPYPQIAAGLAKRMPAGKRLDRIDLDLDNGHDGTPTVTRELQKFACPKPRSQGIRRPQRY